MPKITPQEIKSGMVIKIERKVKENDKEKTSHLHGLVIAKKHGNQPQATITLRRLVDGVGVEWILPIFSPSITNIELVKESKTRRAKLYYLRTRSPKQIRTKLKKTGKSKKVDIIEEEQNNSNAEIITETNQEIV